MRPKLTAPPPKPCPRCYAPMAKVDDEWACAKHGAPPLRLVTTQPARAPAPKPEPRGQPTGVLLYCGDQLVPVLKLRGVTYCSRCRKHLSVTPAARRLAR